MHELYLTSWTSALSDVEITSRHNTVGEKGYTTGLRAGADEFVPQTDCVEVEWGFMCFENKVKDVSNCPLQSRLLSDESVCYRAALRNHRNADSLPLVPTVRVASCSVWPAGEGSNRRHLQETCSA